MRKIFPDNFHKTNIDTNNAIFHNDRQQREKVEEKKIP